MECRVLLTAAALAAAVVHEQKFMGMPAESLLQHLGREVDYGDAGVFRLPSFDQVVNELKAKQQDLAFSAATDLAHAERLLAHERDVLQRLTGEETIGQEEV